MSCRLCDTTSTSSSSTDLSRPHPWKITGHSNLYHGLYSFLRLYCTPVFFCGSFLFPAECSMSVFLFPNYSLANEPKCSHILEPNFLPLSKYTGTKSGICEFHEQGTCGLGGTKLYLGAWITMYPENKNFNIFISQDFTIFSLIL